MARQTKPEKRQTKQIPSKTVRNIFDPSKNQRAGKIAPVQNPYQRDIYMASKIDRDDRPG
jgi:hypothetical protein